MSPEATILIQPGFDEAEGGGIPAVDVGSDIITVLAKPFDPVEVTHVLGLAWLNWKNQYESAGSGNERVMAATSR